MMMAPRLAGSAPDETSVCGLDIVATGACQQMGVTVLWDMLGQQRPCHLGGQSPA